MAARKELSHLDRTRRKIQASMLINRLTEHVKGEPILNASQVTAALGLIKKVVPDLSAVEVTMDANLTVAEYDLDKLDDSELSAVESALLKAAVSAAGESGDGEAEPNSLH